MRSARPSAAPADRRRARARSRRAGPRHPTARAAAHRRDARRRTPQAARAPGASASSRVQRRARAPAPGRRSAAPTDVRTGNGTETPCRPCGAAARSVRGAGAGAALERRHRPPTMRPAWNGSSPAIGAEDRRLAGARRSHDRHELAARRRRTSRRSRICRSPRRRQTPSQAAGRGRSCGRRFPSLFEPPRQGGKRQRHGQIERGAQRALE